jgi:uncharacterized cupin superfamily protein
MEIANLKDEGKGREVAVGHLQGNWRDIGTELGSRGIGLRRIRIAPGHFSTPAHEHGAEEEVFFVLGGEGLLWQAGETYAVGEGDFIVHLPATGPHTLRAGDAGLDVLIFGERGDASVLSLPRAGLAWTRPRWVLLADEQHPFAREAAAGPPDCPPPRAERPRHIVALAELPATFGGRARRAGQAGGLRRTGLNHVALAAGEAGAAAHCHSAEEEIFVVLDGGGVLELWQRGADVPEERPLLAGDVFHRPPGTGVAHALRPGDGGIAYLAYGTREPNDMCFYPQSGRVSLRGLGIALRSPEIEHLPGI